MLMLDCAQVRTAHQHDVVIETLRVPVVALVQEPLQRCRFAGAAARQCDAGASVKHQQALPCSNVLSEECEAVERHQRCRLSQSSVVAPLSLTC